MPPPNVPRRQQLFEVWIRPVPHSAAHFALRAAVREVEKLAAEGLDDEAFTLTRNFFTTYSLHLADTTATRLGYAVDDVRAEAQRLRASGLREIDLGEAAEAAFFVPKDVLGVLTELVPYQAPGVRLHTRAEPRR